MTTVYLGYPPENVKNWILEHSAPAAKTPVWGSPKVKLEFLETTDDDEIAFNENGGILQKSTYGDYYENSEIELYKDHAYHGYSDWTYHFPDGIDITNSTTITMTATRGDPETPFDGDTVVIKLTFMDS